MVCADDVAETVDLTHSYQHEQQPEDAFDDENEALLLQFSPPKQPTTVLPIFHDKLPFSDTADANDYTLDWRTLMSFVVFVVGLVSFLLAYTKGSPRYINPNIIPTLSVPTRMPLSLSKTPNVVDSLGVASIKPTGVPFVLKTTIPTLSPNTGIPSSTPSRYHTPSRAPLRTNTPTISPLINPSTSPITTDTTTEPTTEAAAEPTTTAAEPTTTAAEPTTTTTTTTTAAAAEPTTEATALIPTITPTNTPFLDILPTSNLIPSSTTATATVESIDNPTGILVTTDDTVSSSTDEFILTSSLLNSYMDSQYTCTDADGSMQDGISPPLQWSNPPANTVEYLLAMSSVYGKTGTEKFNWVVYGIDGSARGIEEDCNVVNGCSVGVIGGTYPGK